MTLSQGKLLIKLIDRETDQTSYDLVKQLRGGFRAFFWQQASRLFGANLKDTYDAEGDDQIIEELIMLYEAGLLLNRSINSPENIQYSTLSGFSRHRRNASSASRRNRLSPGMLRRDGARTTSS